MALTTSANTAKPPSPVDLTTTPEWLTVALAISESWRATTYAADEIWPQAAAAVRETGNPYLVSLIDTQRATFGTEPTPELVAHYEELVHRLDGSGSTLLMALACGAYGDIRFASGDTERGLELWRTGVKHAQRAGPLVDSSISGLSAPLFLLAGQTDTAAALIRRSLPLSRDLGQTSSVAQQSAVAALIAAVDGDLAAAAALSSAAKRHLDAVGLVGSRPANICLERAEALIADSPQDLSEAQARGARMTVEETVNLAVAVLDRYHPMALNG